MSRWSHLVKLVEAWQEQQFGRTTGRIRNLHRYFADLLGFVQQHEVVNLSEPALALEIALAVLGPDDEPQLAKARTELRQIITNLPDSSPSCDLELVIAWGCGWGKNSPAQRWSKALFALSDIVEGSINKSIDLLAQRLDLTPGRRQNGALSAQKMHELANLISLEMVHDRCSCGNHRQACHKKPDGQRSCGRPCCRVEHKLSTWNPDDCSLLAFVAQAVRGRATADLQTGVFSSSALYPRLAEDIGLQVAPVEFKVCTTCHHTLVVQLIRVAEGGQKTGGLKISALPKNKQTRQPLGLYQAARCPDCGTVANRNRTYYLARKNWLIIPYNINGGTYKPVKRWRCPFCKNLYPPHLGQCPLCRQEQTRRLPSVHVWVFQAQLLWSQKKEE